MTEFSCSLRMGVHIFCMFNRTGLKCGCDPGSGCQGCLSFPFPSNMSALTFSYQTGFSIFTPQYKWLLVVHQDFIHVCILTHSKPLGSSSKILTLCNCKQQPVVGRSQRDKEVSSLYNASLLPLVGRNSFQGPKHFSCIKHNYSYDTYTDICCILVLKIYRKLNIQLSS